MAHQQDQVVPFNCHYVNLCGDPRTALMLSQIVYWYQPDSDGKRAPQRYHQGNWWYVYSHKDWQAALGLSRAQTHCCIEKLVNLGLIEAKVFKFNGTPTVHLRLLEAGVALIPGENHGG